MECPVPECKQRQPTEIGRKLKRLRPWVQTGFLGLWLAPMGQWLHGIPSCVFHCYSCPLSSFGCPIGILANYAALLPVALEVPYLLLGLLLPSLGLLHATLLLALVVVAIALAAVWFLSETYAVELDYLER